MLFGVLHNPLQPRELVRCEMFEKIHPAARAIDPCNLAQRLGALDLDHDLCALTKGFDLIGVDRLEAAACGRDIDRTRGQGLAGGGQPALDRDGKARGRTIAQLAKCGSGAAEGCFLFAEHDGMIVSAGE